MTKRIDQDRELRIQLIDWRLAWLEQGGAALKGSAQRRARRQLERWNAAAEDERTLFVPTDDGGGGWIKPLDASELEELPVDKAASRLAEQGDWDAGSMLKDQAHKDLDRAFDIFDRLTERFPEKSARLLESLAAGAGESDEPSRFILTGPRLESYLRLADAERFGHWGYCQWLQVAADRLSVSGEGDSRFWAIWDQVWDSAIARQTASRTDDADKVTEALSSAGGKLCLALLDRLWKRENQENAGFPDDLAARIDGLIDGQVEAHKHARMMLVSRLVWLFRIDPIWCQRHLLNSMADFDTNPRQATELWQAFLWPARVSAKLWPDLKPGLYAALDQYGGFSDDARRLVGFFAVNLLRPGAFDDDSDKKTLLKLFPRFSGPQLEAIAHAFEDGLRATAQGAPEFWRERIAPLFETYWPLLKSVQSRALGAVLGAMLLETRDAFPEAVQLVIEDKPVLSAAGDLFHAIYRLNRKGPQGDDQTVRFPYAERFPLELLRLLDVLVDPEVTQVCDNDLLNELLGQIEMASPDASGREEMVRLRDFLRSG